jgi:hypothetical protein
VVGHQTISPDLDPEFGAGFGQPIPIERVVLVVEENALAPVASLRDVMRRAGKDNASDARHAGEHTGACAMCKDGRVTVIRNPAAAPRFADLLEEASHDNLLAAFETLAHNGRPLGPSVVCGDDGLVLRGRLHDRRERVALRRSRAGNGSRPWADGSVYL